MFLSLIPESWSEVLDKMLGGEVEYRTSRPHKQRLKNGCGWWNTGKRGNRKYFSLSIKWWSVLQTWWSICCSPASHCLSCLQVFVHVLLAWHTLLAKFCLIFNSIQASPPPRKAFVDPTAQPWSGLASIMSTSWYLSIVSTSCICVSLFSSRLWAHWKWTTMPGTEQVLSKYSRNEQTNKYGVGRRSS